MSPLRHFLFLLTLLISPPPTLTSADTSNQDLLKALQEMRRATYFAFVVLINMAPDDFIQGGNITFLMPNNRILANTTIPHHNVSDFLRRHSIPTPLLIDDFLHFPTGSLLPTTKPDFMLRVGNYGRRHFFLNNVRVISPNICSSAASSIRCHGIDGVIVETYEGYNSPPPLVSPSPSPCYVNSTTTAPVASPPAPEPVGAAQPALAAAPAGAAQPTPAMQPPDDSMSYTPAMGPALNFTKNSGFSGKFSGRGLVKLVMICRLVLLHL